VGRRAPGVAAVAAHGMCPERRGVRGCICCAAACLLFLHCWVYLEFSVSSRQSVIGASD
jgi:hypothetical protein